MQASAPLAAACNDRGPAPSCSSPPSPSAVLPAASAKAVADKELLLSCLQNVPASGNEAAPLLAGGPEQLNPAPSISAGLGDGSTQLGRGGAAHEAGSSLGRETPRSSARASFSPPGSVLPPELVEQRPTRGTSLGAQRFDDDAVLMGSPSIGQHPGSPHSWLEHSREAEVTPEESAGRIGRLDHAVDGPEREQAVNNLPSAAGGVEHEAVLSDEVSANRDLQGVPAHQRQRQQQQQQRSSALRQVAARRSLPPKQTLRQPLKQQVWSFGAIPQSTASGNQSARPARREAAGGRPAFYPRAGSPRRPAALPEAAQQQKTTATSQQKASGSIRAGAQVSRQPGGSTRLEQLAQPRHAVPAKRPLQMAHHPAATEQSLIYRLEQRLHGPGTTHGTAGALAPAYPTSGQQADDQPSRSPCIAAEHGSGSRSAAVAEQRWNETSSHAPAAAGWPQALGRPLSGIELQRATGAYSQERFDSHLQSLTAALAARRQRRGEADDQAAAGAPSARFTAFLLRSSLLPHFVYRHPSQMTSRAIRSARRAGVDADVVEQMRQLSSGAPAGPAAAADNAPTAEPPACRPPEEGGAQRSQAGTGPRLLACQLAPLPEPESRGDQLLCCLLRLQQRPKTAPASRPAASYAAGPVADDHRPATATASRVKSLMRVKCEQERTLWALQSQPQHFRASPLPLSTMQPRYERQQAAWEQRRAESLEARRRELLGGQQPFGMERREAERRQRRRMLHWEPTLEPGSVSAGFSPPGGHAPCNRPSTPYLRHAQPVPVSTTEASIAVCMRCLFCGGTWVR